MVEGLPGLGLRAQGLRAQKGIRWLSGVSLRAFRDPRVQLAP